MNALTNEFSRGHFQEALRFGWMLQEDPTLQEELRGDPRRLGIIPRYTAQSRPHNITARHPLGVTL